MDPVSVGLLVALAGGVAGEVGRQTWAGLSALVRRPLGRDGGQAPDIGSGEAELTRLAADPGDQGRAQALSTALAVRAAVDEDFRAGLAAWQERAALLRAGDGAVTNSVSGGTQNGPVLQAGTSPTRSSTPHPPLRPPPAVPGTARWTRRVDRRRRRRPRGRRDQ
ncbi:hypothetical protein [Streptomyces yangpuensis]|uniref:hypothetical protein n=1 Tax=Streptomyces yangpuensis TaxID=1648182 RepID=UPI0036C18001